MFVEMAYNGVVRNRNVLDHNCLSLMILASIIKESIRIIICVKIIVIVLLLGMIGLIMFVLRLGAVFSVAVGRFLIIPLPGVSRKENNARKASIITLLQDNVRLNVNQILLITPHLRHVFQWLTKAALMMNSLIVKHRHVLKNV